MNEQNKGMSYVGAGIHEGQDLKGVQLGTQAIRESGLFQSLKQKYGVQVKDYGNVNCSTLSQQDRNRPNLQHHVRNLNILDPLLKQVSQKVKQSILQHKENVIVTVGGDHSVATGSIGGLLQSYPDLKVIWVDAHPDFIDCKYSKYPGYHGMPLSHLSAVNPLPGFQWLTNFLPTKNIVLIGIRDIDSDEWISLKKHKIKCFTTDHIDQYGIGKVMQIALQYLDPQGTAAFHISFDIDALDPHLVTGTGTKFRDGLTHREACHIIRRTAHYRKLVGLDVVQINPLLEEHTPRFKFRGQQNLKQVGETVGLGIDLIECLFTKYLTL